MIFWIDLFAGAGGTTTGIHLVDQGNRVKVVACVNHDLLAIESHKANHPECIHFIEDVRDLNVVLALKKLVASLRKDHPGCLINIWASLECINYSKAKGGLPRDPDSRTLAHAMYMYLDQLNPDYFYVENVREFMSWGPLDDKGRPVSKLNGRDYIRWCKKVQSYGYRYDWQLLNAADFGAYTSRERYFGQFAKQGLPINWPEPTHTKKPVKGGLFGALEKWKPVRDVLDLRDEGRSIFDRKKPLAEKTLERIYAGLIKFVAGGKDTFMIKYKSMNQRGTYVAPDVDEPSPVVTTQNRLGVAQVNFLSKYFSGRPYDKNISIEGPAHTIKTIDNHALVTSSFLSHYYGNGYNTSTDEPCPTLRTKDSVVKVETQFIDQQYGTSKPSGIEQPLGAITTNPKYNLVSCSPWIMDTSFSNVGNDIDRPSGVITASRKHHYLMNPQYSNTGGSVEHPCFTLIARMDKMPPYLIVAENGSISIQLFATDSEMTVKIKQFMAMYGILDIKMRMLRIDELLRIQGFPAGYVLTGTVADKKKFIGNAVETTVARRIAEANAGALLTDEAVAI